MRVFALCLIAPLAASAAAQNSRPVPRAATPATRSAAVPATPATADKPSSTAAHFTAAGLNNEDDLVRIYTGDFPSIRLDRGGPEFMMIISGYMEDFGRACKQFLPPNKVEITVQVCNDPPSTSVPYSPDGVHDAYGNRLPMTTGCSGYHTEGTGVYADPNLYNAVNAVTAKSQVNLIQNMLGAGKGGRAANPLTNPGQLTDQIVAVAGETTKLISANGCGSVGLKNFQSNLIRFANGAAPIKYSGAVVSAPVAVLPGFRDADFTRLLDDLVADNSRGWIMNRYQAGSISEPIASHDPTGAPTRVMARFRYVGGQQGRINVTFKNGAPDCLYFSDAPDSCRLPSQRIISAYEKNAYARYTAAQARQSPFAEGCNAFMKAPKTSRYAPSDPEGYCQCLSNGYQKVMTPAEEVFYGQNFEAKFWRGIAQPKSDDPAWSRLNPVAVSCMQ
jgi:hypothetical protein